MLAGPFLETIKAQSKSSCPYDMAMELQLLNGRINIMKYLGAWLIGVPTGLIVLWFVMRNI